MVHYSGAVRDLHLSFSAAKGVHMLGCWVPLHKGKRSIWRFSGVVPDDLRRFVSFLSRSRQKRCLCDFRINLFLYRSLEINDPQLNIRSPRSLPLSLSHSPAHYSSSSPCLPCPPGTSTSAYPQDLLVQSHPIDDDPQHVFPISPHNTPKPIKKKEKRK